LASLHVVIDFYRSCTFFKDLSPYEVQDSTLSGINVSTISEVIMPAGLVLLMTGY